MVSKKCLGNNGNNNTLAYYLANVKMINKKFEKFGKGNRRINSKDLKKKMSDKPYICSWENCEKNRNLIIDHLKPISADGSNERSNLRWLCKKHDRIRNIDYVLKRKIAEVKKLKEEKEKLLLQK